MRSFPLLYLTWLVTPDWESVISIDKLAKNCLSLTAPTLLPHFDWSCCLLDFMPKRSMSRTGALNLDVVPTKPPLSKGLMAATKVVLWIAPFLIELTGWWVPQAPGEQLEGLGRTSTLTDLTNTGVLQAFERVCQTAHRKLQLGVLSIMDDAAGALWQSQPSVQEKAYLSWNFPQWHLGFCRPSVASWSRMTYWL